MTVAGNVATAPEMKQSVTGVPYTRFRLAATERRYDRATDRWADGHTNFYTVWAWRALAENVAASVGVGEPVVVHGKLRIVEREDKGQTYTVVAIDAAAIGHDMNRGTSAFRRTARLRMELADPPAELAPPQRTTPPKPPGRAKKAQAAADQERDEVASEAVRAPELVS
ncbi:MULTISPECIES: single-stranded DNA-binding protein [Streptomycetaceae]|uniref:single-stranded DNA-binding protein n=1 Tax=Streptomycetaceae TaxID=2062 RepID=UPI001E434EE8|nr:single-stranded DNA-binding protein [Streptantibioticus cattleyicolor]